MNLNHLVAKEVVYQGKNLVVKGKVLGAMQTYEGKNLLLIRATGGIEYMCDIHHTHLVEELASL